MLKTIKNLIVLSFCLIIVVSPTIGNAAGIGIIPTINLQGDEPPVPQSPNTVDLTNTLYLPCVTIGCPGTTPSPFSIQIAGLSEFTPPAGMSKAEADRLRAEQLAELDAAMPALVEALRDSGAGWARVYIDWTQIQPTDPSGGTPVYNWAWYDTRLAQIASAGVELIVTVSNPPTWAAVNKAGTPPPCSNRIAQARMGDFHNFLRALINRYKVAPYNAHVWELLNEPDVRDGHRCTLGLSNYGQHGADYAAMLSQTYPVVKAADPTAKVISGGVANDWFYLPTNDPNYDGSPQGQFNRYFMDDIVSNGAANSVDAFNFHYFHDFHLEWERWTTGNLPTCGTNTMRDPSQPTYLTYGMDVLAKGSHFQNRLKTCYGVDKPLWITEVGHHGMSHPDAQRADWTLDNQARYVFTVYARALSLGAENITWYALKIIPSVTTEDFQGLLYDSRHPALENQPKPAFYAFKTLATELDGFTYAATATGLTNAEAYVFTNPCQARKIIAWYNGTTGSTPLVIPSVNSAKLVYRPNNDGSPRVQTVVDGGAGDLDQSVNGSISISLTVEPVIIQTSP